MLKKELRKYYSDLRRNLSCRTIEIASLSIANQLLSIPVWSFEYYHIFLPIKDKNEIDTQPILSALSGRDKSIVIPRIISANQFSNILLTDSTRVLNNRWGIPEPVDGIEVPVQKIDLVFLPLLAYDLSGHRVGYGKGYYDAFLSVCRKDVVKVGLSYFGPEDKIEDVHQGDIALDYCVTPEKIYRF